MRACPLGICESFLPRRAIWISVEPLAAAFGQPPTPHSRPSFSSVKHYLQADRGRKPGMRRSEPGPRLKWERRGRTAPLRCRRSPSAAHYRDLDNPMDPRGIKSVEENTVGGTHSIVADAAPARRIASGRLVAVLNRMHGAPGAVERGERHWPGCLACRCAFAARAGLDAAARSTVGPPAALQRPLLCCRDQ
jgi:hypothetical protein